LKSEHSLEIVELRMPVARRKLMVLAVRPPGSLAMPAIDDDGPKKKIVHEIGQEIALLSVAELSERIEVLRDEISRLEAAVAGKRASRSAADQFFKK
jgi:uncharacterized small protein (DUF1192 family)